PTIAIGRRATNPARQNAAASGAANNSRYEPPFSPVTYFSRSLRSDPVRSTLWPTDRAGCRYLPRPHIAARFRTFRDGNGHAGYIRRTDRTDRRNGAGMAVHERQ